MKKIARFVSSLLAAGLLFGCSHTTVIYDDALDPNDIVLTEKEKVLALGETYQIQASFVVDGNPQSVALSFKSLNPSVATVSSTGLVEALGIGEAIIQVTYEGYKSLLKIVVQAGQESSLLGLTIQDRVVSLYEGERYDFRYDVRFNGLAIDVDAVYSDYDSSIIAIEDDVITAKGVGSTAAKIKVNYGGISAEETFSITVMAATYYLSCNYEGSQVVVGEEDLSLTYSLNHGRENVRTLSLSELSVQISDEDIATFDGNSIKGLKKGAFDLSVSYQVPETGETIISTDSFRSRERYLVHCMDLFEPIRVLNGERISYVPRNEDPNLVFDSWLKDGAEFDEPVESDLTLGIRWKINEFNFTQDVRGAKSIAPSEGESIDAVSYTDDADYANGLKYVLSKNCHDGSATEDIVASIALPRMDYRKISKVTYLWKTNGYVTIDMNHWYGGALSLGGTIDITFDGTTITETITQTYAVQDPWSGADYRGATRTVACRDAEVIRGEKNLESIQYWAYESIIAESCIYLSNPMVSVSHDYLPYFRLGNYTGSIFKTDDPNAHYASESYKPTIVQNIAKDGGVNDDYLYYYQDRAYDESQGWIHCRADYTLTLPAVDFASQSSGITMPFEIEGGFYVGFDETKITTEPKGQLRFQYEQDSGLTIAICSEIGATIHSYLCLDSEVINGTRGFTFPVCYSTHCFARGLLLYQPRPTERCVNHDFEDTLVTDRIGYFGTVCKICGESGPHSDNLMRRADIDFTVAQYGAQGGKWGTNVQPTAKTMTFEVTDGNVENIIQMPRINFGLYTTVSFVLSGNVWDARVGLESGSYAFPYRADAAHSGTLTFSPREGAVGVSLVCHDGINQSLTITDPAVISGEESFPLYMVADDAYRAITIELRALQDECEHDYAVSTDMIGAEVCSICGDQRNYKTDLNDVDFTLNQYGARGGRWDTSVQPTAKTMKFEVTQGNVENAINLPRINYRSFASVQFGVTCGSFAIGAGLKSGEYILPGSTNNTDPAHTGILTFAMNGNQLVATLTCNETSESQSIIIEDENVISGAVSACLYMYSIQFAYQEIILELTALN